MERVCSYNPGARAHMGPSAREQHRLDLEDDQEIMIGQRWKRFGKNWR